MATKYNEYEDSESSGGSGSDDDGPKDPYMTAKKIKLPSHLQIGGIGDDDENSDNDEYDDDDEDDPDEPNLEHLETEVAMKNAFFDNSDDDDEEGEDSDEEEENADENYLQKFSGEMRKNVIAEHHPELLIHNYHEIEAMCNIVRNERGIIVDPLHKTLPFITKYERAKLLGERARCRTMDANTGAWPI